MLLIEWLNYNKKREVIMARSFHYRKGLKAIDGSIKKWKVIVYLNGEDHGISNCPLCLCFYSKEGTCQGCPISIYSGSYGCGGTPYTDWSEYCEDIVFDTETTALGKVTDKESLRLANKELVFLYDVRLWWINVWVRPDYDVKKIGDHLMFDMSYSNKTYEGDTIVFTPSMVCKSAAGFYIGSYCKTIESNEDWKVGLIEPYSRDSFYYPDYKSAKEALEKENY